MADQKKSVSTVLDSQRKEGEARELLKDLEELISLRRERKLRWIWELIQNAVDCAGDKTVNIIVDVDESRVLFEHDGDPFQIENLVALTRKTSTKSVEGVDGKKGKFGTGFVTTHTLNRKVTISGIFKNETGRRQFSLLLDRSPTELSTITNCLDSTFAAIDKINESPDDINIKENRSVFEYILDEYSTPIATEGLNDLRRNLAVTLLVNRVQLGSITIRQNNESEKYSVDEPKEIRPGIGFSKLIIEGRLPFEEEEGLIVNETRDITIAIPAIKRKDQRFSLQRVANHAKLFRNFPLIGTEQAHLPCFIHSEHFQPTLQRDGIRTLKEREENSDKHADENRLTLTKYVDQFKFTFSVLNEAGVENLHLLAESGLPLDDQNYLAIEWYIKSIQHPIRSFLELYPLVRTIDGTKILLTNALIPSTVETNDDEFFSLASEYLFSKCPDKNSYGDWQSILNQDRDRWSNQTKFDLEFLVKELSDTGGVESLRLFSEGNILWINRLIKYIHKTNNIPLTETYPIYPNQSGLFRKRLALRLDPGFDSEIKDILIGLGRNLRDQFILDEISDKTGILPFEVGEFFKSINDFVGNLDCTNATESQSLAIIQLSCYFKDTNAPRRAEWYSLISQLLPSIITRKYFSAVLETFNFEPIDKWTLKYVSFQIEKTNDVKTFALVFFEAQEINAFYWLNEFLNFVCRSEEGRDASFKFKIVPTQDGLFKKIDNLIREANPLEFEPFLKDLVKDYTAKGDPKTYLIDSRIQCEFFKSENIDFLTEQIDKLFSDGMIEKEVEESGKLNSLFHKLNDWYSKEEQKDESKSNILFPIFTGKRADLSVRAYGKEMSKIMAEKGIEEIKALTKLTLKAQELSQLEHAARLAGGTQRLVTEAQKIHEEAEAIRWRKEVGKAAENAFNELMLQTSDQFDVENPDRGKDFTIISPKTGKEFYVEIKSAVEGEESIKMSALQGLTANKEKHRYALCVIIRPSGMIIQKEYFLANVKFVMNIGDLIGDKLDGISNDLLSLSKYEAGDVNVAMDKKTYSVYVKKGIWHIGIGFQEFIDRVNTYLLTE